MERKESLMILVFVDKALSLISDGWPQYITDTEDLKLWTFVTTQVLKP